MVLRIKVIFVFTAILLASLISNAAIPRKIERSIDKALVKHIGHINFSKKEIVLDEDQKKNLRYKNHENQLFQLNVGSEKYGFIYIELGKGRYHGFTFFVLVNNELEIELVKVVEYNENYGAEITNKKWLAQFKGLKPGSVIKYNKTIDAISGATISSASITERVALVLEKFNDLRTNSLI